MNRQSYHIDPGQTLAGELRVPGDKSISHRSVMLGAIARGETVVRGFLEGEDCRATLAAFTRMGVHWRRDIDGSLVIAGAGPRGLRSPQDPLDLGNSGTGMRLLLGLLAGQNVRAVLTGDASLSQRPMERVAAPLRLMGAEIATVDGHAPIELLGQPDLRGIRYELPVASAQIKSALLLAGLGANGQTEVHAPAPTRDHTERMLRAMGVEVEVSSDGLGASVLGPAELHACEIHVPGDLSSAAFFIVGACIGGSGPLVIRNVGVNPTRDGLITILQLMGAHIELEHRAQLGSEPVADIRIFPGALTGIEIPPELVPLAIDELPILFVAAAVARGTTTVTGASELRVKETDRIGAMARALAATGIRVAELPDGIVIEGGQFSGGTVDSCGDHRIAMSFAVASLVSDGPMEIHDTGPVATSFPGFVDSATGVGLAIDVRSD